MSDSKPKIIKLNWKGPYKWDSFDSKLEKNPGIYIWVVGKKPKYTLSYIGEADDIKSRLRDHLVQVLGGGYWLYKPGQIRNCRFEKKEPAYRTDWFFDRYLTEPQEHFDIAMSNLKIYSFFFAYHEKLKDNKTRKSVESALIMDAERYGLFRNMSFYYDNKKRFLQNEKISLSAENSLAVRVTSKIKNIVIEGITKDDEVEYGNI